MRFRKWLAWKLQQLAAKVYYAEWEEAIEIQTSSGREMKIWVLGDEYGCGISSIYGIPWNMDGESPMTAEVDGVTFRWPDPVKVDLSEDV